MRRLLFASLIVVGVTGAGPARGDGLPRAEGVAMTTARNDARLSAAELRVAMRRLWEDRTALGRSFMVSSLAGLADADAVALRLLANQDAIGAVFKPFYGPAAGDRLAVLLRDQIMIAADVVKAARGRDPEAQARAQLAWATNADQLAGFLADLNPAWSRAELVAMLRRHLRLTMAEVSARLRGDWAADLDAHEVGRDHMLRFADVLSDGVVKQHRRRFGR